MAIRNFKFPGVELNQEFVQTPVTGVSTLGVVIVGQQYKLITADLNDKSKVISWQYNGTKAVVPLTTTEIIDGATVTINLPGYIKADTEKGEDQTQTLDPTWDSNKVKVAVQNAQFENYVATSDTPVAILGNEVETREVEVSVDGGTETTTATQTTTIRSLINVDGTNEEIGNTLTINSDTYSTATVPFSVYLSDASTVATAAFGKRYPEVGDTVVIAGSTGSATGVITAIKSGLVGTETTVEVEGSTPTVTTEWTTNKASAIKVTITKKSKDFDGTEVTSIGFLITEDTVFDAAVTTGVDEGLLLTNPTKKIEGKTGAISLIAGVYNVSPTCRYSDTAYVGQLGSVGSYTEIEEIFGTPSAVDNQMALALLFALYAANTNVVYFTAVAANDAPSYARAMDYLNRYDYIYSVVPMVEVTDASDTGVDIIKTILTNVLSASENAESKVRRTLWYGIETPTGYGTSAEIADAIIGIRESVAASYRAQAVWADGAYFNGEEVPNFILAAAPAGMRSYEPTYRPISNLGYTFFSLKDTNGFTNSELLELGANGIWIIDNNYEGTPSNKKQVTTAVANNLNLDEESIVANADSIALTLCHVGEDLVGCSNISPALLKSLSDTITAIMDNYLINRTGNAYIGPQLLSWTLDSLYQHDVLLDHIYAVITCEPPKPFNRFVMTLRIV